MTPNQKSRDSHFVHAPEVVPGTGPELVPGISPEAVGETSDCPQLEKHGHETSNAPKSVRRFSRQRRIIIVFSIVACLLIVGLAVGLGVGLNVNKNSRSDQR